MSETQRNIDELIDSGLEQWREETAPTEFESRRLARTVRGQIEASRSTRIGWGTRSAAIAASVTIALFSLGILVAPTDWRSDASSSAFLIGTNAEGAVVIEAASGKRAFTVKKSYDPRPAAPSETEVARGGSYVDENDGTVPEPGTVVFYRID